MISYGQTLHDGNFTVGGETTKWNASSTASLTPQTVSIINDEEILTSISMTFLYLLQNNSSPKNKIIINCDLDLLKPAVTLRSTRFNIQKFYMALALPLVFCTDIRTDSDFCFIQHKLIGFYNCGRKCLLCGTN